jgi:hypothetical protein
MKAWHFTSDKLRDGTPIPKPGEKLIFNGEPELCRRGYHASKRIIDALQYAPGYIIHRVELSGRIIEGDDKLVATERTILFSVNGEELLKEFARKCAMDCIHFWNPPEIVVKYLKTGDESLRAAASAAASAAREAAWDASAARAAASAASAAAWDASAASAAARAARAAASDASAASAARAAASDKQNRRLTSMVIKLSKSA